MEELFNILSKGIVANDYATLSSVFSDTGSNSWQAVGQGEQRSLAAHFIHAAVTAPNFLPSAFDSPDIVEVCQVALGHLPATVEQAADNSLRQTLFDYMVQQDDPDYAGAARILGGMRMETDAESLYYMPPAARCDVYVKVRSCVV
jgi:hypothetical protein